MGRWQYTPSLESASTSNPLFLRIARAITDDVRSGRLRAGERLPGSRALAASIGVHRNTVVAAYGELEAEGWLTTAPTSGTFVSATLPDSPTRRFTASTAARHVMPEQTGFELRAGAVREPSLQPGPGRLVFRASAPDPRLMPFDLLGRAYRRALQLHGPSLLEYREPEGHPRLRTALAAMLATTRGLAATGASVFITRGSQMALHLTAMALLAPGDRVAVEALGYRQAREAFRAAGAHLVSIPIDQYGLDVSSLEAAHATAPIRAVYLTSHHQFPTTVSLSPGRRIALRTFARRERIAIIEDDYDHEFHYEGRPLLPMASADQYGSVIYIGSLSTVLAPGLRIGYVVAPCPFIQQLAAHRALVDMHGDHALEYAVAELIEDGELQRHVRRTRREYAKRRLALAEGLARGLGDRVSFSLPTGGTGIWVRANHDIHVEDWLVRAGGQGVAFETARSFTFDGQPRPFVRLGFAALNEREISDATRRLLAAWPPSKQWHFSTGHSWTMTF